MKIYNSMTKQKEEFVPLDENEVKIYACGITVYDQCHIGHARQAITYDMMCQYLRFRGYNVKYVRNYTDVDDKIIARANEQGVNALTYSNEKIIEAEKDLASIKVKDADIKPRASEYIDHIISFVSELIQKGHAYATQKGDVYFSVKTFNDYGKLSKRNIDELINGVRKDVEEGKKDPIDFALWKAAKPGEISWKSPWGEGRPGWHIECSTMALNNLGESIDIHGGGKDLVFPHHENEIAQSEALTGKPFAKYWSHNGLIKVNGQKMSKSLGNSMTIKQAVELYNQEVIRFAMLSKHYSTDLDLNDYEFSLAQKHMYYFYNTLNNMNIYIDKNYKEDVEIQDQAIDLNIINNIEKNFIEQMDDDFNTSTTIALLFDIFKYCNTLLVNKKADSNVIANVFIKVKNDIIRLYSILGLMQEDTNEFIKDLKEKYLSKLDINVENIEKNILDRQKAKEEKNYQLADEIRSNLDNKGIILNDSKEGTTWDIKELYNL